MATPSSSGVMSISSSPPPWAIRSFHCSWNRQVGLLGQREGQGEGPAPAQDVAGDQHARADLLALVDPVAHRDQRGQLAIESRMVVTPYFSSRWANSSASFLVARGVFDRGVAPLGLAVDGAVDVVVDEAGDEDICRARRRPGSRAADAGSRRDRSGRCARRGPGRSCRSGGTAVAVDDGGVDDGDSWGSAARAGAASARHSRAAPISKSLRVDATWFVSRRPPGARLANQKPGILADFLCRRTAPSTTARRRHNPGLTGVQV